MKKIYIFSCCVLFNFFCVNSILADGSTDPETSIIPLSIPLVEAAQVDSNGMFQGQIDSVGKSITALSLRVDELQQNVNQFEQQFKQMNQPLSWRQKLKANEIFLISIALLALVVLFLMIMLIRQAKSGRKEVNVQKPNEYDFMGSSEGIPAKLDLVRAYIAMEDLTLAKETLSEILKEGNEEQCREAKSLLNKLLSYAL